MAAIRATRLCLPHLRETRGAIVNVVAIGGKAPGARSLPSTVTRAAGLALTKALSKEFAPDGVRVNAVCIGTVRSGQHDPEWQHAYSHLMRDEFYADFARKRAIPLGRVGEAEEAADLIAYLLSERAAFISGTAVNLDGGASPVG
jgi:NAD(P)-dependent dehydrogenase (short-subunit alcohol dehydrogenase family)